MTWSTIRCVAARELRDLLRDRRTVFMVFFLPVALYPLLGVAGFLFALGSLEQKSIVGIHGMEHLPQPTPGQTTLALLPSPWLTLSPLGGVEQRVAAVALTRFLQAHLEYPSLLVDGQIALAYRTFESQGDSYQVVALASADRAPLERGHVHLILVVPPDFRSRLEEGGIPMIQVWHRENDERSRLADRRLRSILAKWKKELKTVRFLRQGLPADFDETLDVERPQRSEEPFKQVADELQDMMGRFFPFLLIMWALAGALHPAIDLTAGEKERGTLETLLLSPATRGEIVCGKFLAVWAFSAATALWNLLWLGGAGGLASLFLPVVLLHFPALVWCGVLTLLLAALFSAVSMALGAFARSTKEGQYFLLPLFIVTMPLSFLPLVPGVELNWFYSLVPITGATLLLQKLMLAQPGEVTWVYFPLVLLSLAICTALALRWAVAQFHREELLFRESPGFAWRRWLGGMLSR